MKRYSKPNKGFTIVELMVAALISSIMAITVGSMLYYSYLAWSRNRDTVEMQRDATISMDMIARAIRPAYGADVQASGSTLTVGSKSFYVNSGNLWYDPDTDPAISGDEVEIVYGKVNSLSFVEDTTLHTVSVDMVLQNKVDTITVSAVIGYRT